MRRLRRQIDSREQPVEFSIEHHHKSSTTLIFQAISRHRTVSLWTIWTQGIAGGGLEDNASIQALYRFPQRFITPTKNQGPFPAWGHVLREIVILMDLAWVEPYSGTIEGLEHRSDSKGRGKPNVFNSKADTPISFAE